MNRRFNTAGPCRPDWHYMLPPEARLPQARRLIDEGQYFVLHAPRQSGKTTLFHSLAGELNQEARYAVVYASCETAQAAGDDADAAVAAVLRALEAQAADLPDGHRPPPVDDFRSIEAEERLRQWLAAWCRRAKRPVVLFLDEVDALLGAGLITVLRQLRAGFVDRPGRFPQAVALIGLRDVRDYKADLRPEDETLGTSSPFNIKSDSLALRNFTASEVQELYRQHENQTGQKFDERAVERAYELAGGQPWLINALARHVVEELCVDGSEIEARHVEAAKEILIRRRDTHLDSLVARLREARVRRVLEPILTGEPPTEQIYDDDVSFAIDLGLVARTDLGLQIANPIYREIIPRALTATTEDFVRIDRSRFIASDGSLLWSDLLDGFLEFWLANAEWLLRREKSYPEAAAQLLLMAFLHRVVNGATAGKSASIDREFAVGSGRIDLLVRWPHEPEVQCFAVEIKVWRDRAADPVASGLEQLGRYLDRLGLDTGTLVIFDQRSAAAALPKRCGRTELEHDGRRIDLLRL